MKSRSRDNAPKISIISGKRRKGIPAPNGNKSKLVGRKASQAFPISLPRDVKILGKLGSGLYGEVYKGKSGKEKAYKIFGGNSLTGIQRTCGLNFVREAAIYKVLGNRNPGICNIHEIADGYISMDIANHTLQKEMKDVFPIMTALEDMAILLATVDLIHKEEVVHLDIKPGNIVRGKDGKLRLCDMGSASLIPSPYIQAFEKAGRLLRSGTSIDIRSHSSINTSVSTVYSAPEIYLKTYDLAPIYTAADIWSLGVLFLNLLTGYNIGSHYLRKDGDDIKSRRSIPPELPGDFKNRFTADMNREGFSVYGTGWESEFENLSYASMSDVSPYELILIRQREENIFFGEKDKKDVLLVWNLINRMLDPNPFTRITAEECLKSPLFTTNIYINRILKVFYEEYHTRSKRPSYIPALRSSVGDHKATDLFEDIAKIGYTKTKFDAPYKLLAENELLEDRLKRMLKVADYKIEAAFGSYVDPTSAQRQLLYFCTMILAYYAEYALIPSDLPLSDLPKMLEDSRSLVKIRRSFITKYTGSLPNLKKMIYTMTYFLLTEIFNFDLWI